jgi:dTDP-4-amino-4,6-dideoxygalactose transaminase
MAASATPIHVTQPHLPALDDFIPLLREIWDRKVLTNGGPFHQRLEAALAEHLGVGHIALFANATLALVTALQALRITGEVITTPYSFVATAHSLLWNGIQPVFVDIDPETLNLDPARIEAAITPRTTAIMPVHCYGRPCDVAAIQRIADSYNLKVIYDAAHAFGVRTDAGSVLAHGDLSVLSFHATKVFNTFEGGAIVCPDARTKTRIDHLKNFGFVDEVTVVAPGINGKMNEFQAALGLLQLQGIDAAIARRRAIDARYREALAGVRGIRCVAPHRDAANNHSYFPILVGPEFPLARDALYALLKARGIHGRRYFHPLITQFPMYRGLPSAAAGHLPVATAVAQQVICLPIYPALADADVDRVCEVIAQAAARSQPCPSIPTPSFVNSDWRMPAWASSSPGALPFMASSASPSATTAASTTSA